MILPLAPTFAPGSCAAQMLKQIASRSRPLGWCTWSTASRLSAVVWSAAWSNEPGESKCNLAERIVIVSGPVWGVIRPGSPERHPQKNGRPLMTNNARSKTMVTAPTFRDAWKKGQRCHIPADLVLEPYRVTGETSCGSSRAPTACRE